MTVAQRALLGVIRIYKVGISPALGPHCRFHPTCSAYAAEAIEVHGIGGGLIRAVRRLARCHPFHDGGFDPVDGSGRSASKHGLS